MKVMIVEDEGYIGELIQQIIENMGNSCVPGQSLGPDKIERLARCGAGILAKPFSMDSLQEAVRTQLGRTDR